MIITKAGRYEFYQIQQLIQPALNLTHSLIACKNEVYVGDSNELIDVTFLDNCNNFFSAKKNNPGKHFS